jgi:hypothetical protein
MMDWDPRLMMLAGFILLLLGVILPGLMVLHLVTATFLLSFLSYGATFLGTILGLIGSLFYVARRRGNRKDR